MSKNALNAIKSGNGCESAAKTEQESTIDTLRKELDILRHIVGPRLNDEHAELRLTSSVFGSRIENKRHLVSMLDRIILSSQRLASEIQNQQNAEEDKK